MALIKEKPRFANPADYENDTSAWCYEQAELLKQRFAEADLPNIIDSIETGLPRNTLPFDCDYTVGQLRDPEWMPE